MKLNEKIIACRRRAGWSQETLAELVGVSRQAVSKWECGDATPEPAKLLQLARTFGVTTDWLLDDDLGEPEANPHAQTLGQEPAPEPDPQPSPHAQTLDSTPPQPTAYPHWVDTAPGVIARFLRKWGWLAGVYIIIIGLIFVGIGGAARGVLGVFVKATTEELAVVYPFAPDPFAPEHDEIKIYDQNGQLIENPPDYMIDAIIGSPAGPSVSVSVTPNDGIIHGATRVEPMAIVYLVPNLIMTIGVIIMLVGLAVTIALRRVGRADRT